MAIGFKRLLVATDFSPRADMALGRAVKIAGEHGAGLTLFHVCDVDAGHDMIQQLSVEAERRLHRQISALSLPEEAVLTVRVVTGKPFVEIIRGAREQRAELVVVGAHGEHFFKDILFGTTAEKIARKGDCPALVVKRTAHGPYRRVLVAVDFSEESRHALELALRVAPQAQFQVVHIYQGFQAQLRRAGIPEAEIIRHVRSLVREARQNMKEFLGSIEHVDQSIRQELWDGRPHQEIATVAKHVRAELVAVGTTGRSGLPYILLGSVAEHVLREVQCDVLVARAKPARFELP
jgi:nucleotide-binding universal stress UspA family protein